MRVSLVRSASVAAVFASLVVAGGCRSRGASCEAPPTCAQPPAPAPCAPPAPAPCAPPAAAPCAPQAVATRVLPGDVLHGRLTCSDGCQCFYFEGVEYSILSFAVKADGGAAPQVAIEDPDGRPLQLSEEVCGKGPGASAKGLILRRSGTYKATVCKPQGSPETYYAFTHSLELANPEDKTVFLEPGKTETISFVASKGSRVMVEVTPAHSCNVTPKFLSVKDPTGGRALAPEARLEGAPEAWIVTSRGGKKRVDFNASRSGRYTVVVTAEDCTSGKATAHVAVHPPGPNRCLYHGDQACPERPTTPPEPVR
jgi:hypothetical protein